jgi:alkylated DNA repair dioxygenase AlkB
MDQFNLFGNGPIEASIPGLVYEPEFLSRDEEAALLEIIGTLPLQAAKYKEYLARRRVVSYGGSYDFDANELMPTTELDERLVPMRARVAEWYGTEPEKLVHALVAEYAPGTPLGWHRDVANFEGIVGVSLGAAATLRFRPYPYEPSMRKEVVSLVVQPRSIYRMTGDARWKWQHSVVATKDMRWSITFREARIGPPR